MLIVLLHMHAMSSKMLRNLKKESFKGWMEKGIVMMIQYLSAFLSSVKTELVYIRIIRGQENRFTVQN